MIFSVYVPYHDVAIPWLVVTGSPGQVIAMSLRESEVPAGGHDSWSAIGKGRIAMVWCRHGMLEYCVHCMVNSLYYGVCMVWCMHGTVYAWYGVCMVWCMHGMGV